MAPITCSAVKFESRQVNLITCTIPIVDGVAVPAVRGAEYEGIIAGATGQVVTAGKAYKHICAGVAVQRVITGATDQLVIADTARLSYLRPGRRTEAGHCRHRRLSSSSPAPLPLRVLGLASPVSTSSWAVPVMFSILPSLSPAAPLAFQIVLTYQD